MEPASEDGHRAMVLDPEPSPWKTASRAVAAVSSLGSLFNPNPDDPDEPHGPGAPVIRDIATAVAVYQMSSLIADASARAAIQGAASKVISGKAAQLTAH